MSTLNITIKAAVPLPASGGVRTARVVLDAAKAAKLAADALAKATGADVAVATDMPSGNGRRVPQIRVEPGAAAKRRGRPRGTGGRAETKEVD